MLPLCSVICYAQALFKLSYFNSLFFLAVVTKIHEVTVSTKNQIKTPQACVFMIINKDIIYYEIFMMFSYIIVVCLQKSCQKLVFILYEQNIVFL